MVNPKGVDPGEPISDDTPRRDLERQLARAHELIEQWNKLHAAKIDRWTKRIAEIRAKLDCGKF